MVRSRKRNPNLVRFSCDIDKDLHELIKQLGLERSLELDRQVSMRALVAEALWDLAEKYGKAKPGDRPSE